MVEPGGGLGLAAEAAHGVVVLEPVLADDLHRDRSLGCLAGARRGRLVDDPHAAAAQLAEDAEGGNLREQAGVDRGGGRLVTRAASARRGGCVGAESAGISVAVPQIGQVVREPGEASDSQA